MNSEKKAYAIVKLHVDNVIKNQSKKEALNTQIEILSLHSTKESAIVGIESVLKEFPVDKFSIVKKENLYQIHDIQKTWGFLSGAYRNNVHVLDFEIIEVTN